MRIIQKLKTYFRYFTENIRYGDVWSVMASVNYVLFSIPPARDRLIRSRQGMFFCRANTTDFMFANYAYEYKLKKFITRHLDRCRVYLDVGACIGDYSIWLSRQGLRCYAFEPVPSNFNTLKVNVLINNLQQKIKLCNLGLGCRAEKVSFHITDTNKGSCSIDKNGGGKARGIQIRPLDEIAAILGIRPQERILMKIDVEGMEIEVLQGARRFLQESNEIIIIMECTLSSKAQIVTMLNLIGHFEYVDIDENNFAAIKQKSKPAPGFKVRQNGVVLMQ